MIKPEELRIGNLMQDKKDREVTIITVAHISEGLINYWRADVYQPIPLDSEWLAKLGFHEADDDGLFEHDDEELFQLQHRYLENEGKFDHIWDQSCTEAPIEFVHQLQNLFYALTGTELVFSAPIKEERK